MGSERLPWATDGNRIGRSAGIDEQACHAPIIARGWRLAVLAALSWYIPEQDRRAEIDCFRTCAGTARALSRQASRS